MMTIKLSLITIKKQRLLLVKCPYNTELISAVKQIKSIAWSLSLGSWYVPYSMDVLHEIKEILGPIIRKSSRYKGIFNGEEYNLVKVGRGESIYLGKNNKTLKKAEEK